jgi:hypothetical protein
MQARMRVMMKSTLRGVMMTTGQPIAATEVLETRAMHEKNLKAIDGAKREECTRRPEQNGRSY